MILFLLLFSHVLSDFLFQNNKIIKLRDSKYQKKRLTGNLIHAGIHFLISVFMLCYYWSILTIVFVLLLSFLHGVIDYIKSSIQIKGVFQKHRMLVFFLDQGIHFLLILFFSYSINIMTMHQNKIIIYDITELLKYIHTCITQITYFQKLVFSLFLLVLGVWGVGIFIRIYFDQTRIHSSHTNEEIIHSNKDDGIPDGGFIIGILERMFIIIVIVLNMPQIIGFVMATKSIARFKKFQDDSFVEYFIIGSLLSFIPAIIIGVAIKALNVFPY